MKSWTEEELNFLKNNYNNMTYKEIANKINHSLGSVEGTAFRLNLKKDIYYNEKEIKKIKELYPFASKEKILKNLPNREWQNIQAKASKIGCKRLLQWEINLNKTFNLSEQDKIWLAAAIDFEGSLSIAINRGGRKRYATIVEINNTNKPLVEEFKSKCRVNNKIAKTKRDGNRKDVYQLVISNKSFVFAFLKEIMPYLISKKQQAKLIMEFIEIHSIHLVNHKKIYYTRKLFKLTERQKEIVNKIRQLNKRGIK